MSVRVDKAREDDLVAEVDVVGSQGRGEIGGVAREQADDGAGLGVDVDGHVLEEGLLHGVEEEGGVDYGGVRSVSHVGWCLGWREGGLVDGLKCLEVLVAFGCWKMSTI